MRLSAIREPDGYRTADGHLMLDRAGYRLENHPCDGCDRSRSCGWYTGHGPSIRWFCDECAGVLWCEGPAEILAPPGLEEA